MCCSNMLCVFSVVTGLNESVLLAVRDLPCPPIENLATKFSKKILNVDTLGELYPFVGMTAGNSLNGLLFLIGHHNYQISRYDDQVK